MIDTKVAADRIRPGNDRSPVKFTFTSAASAFQTIRATDANSPTLGPQYVSFRVTADAHVVFGASAALTTDPTNASPLFTSGDGYQDFTLDGRDQGFKIKGDTAGGDIYLFFS